MVRRLVHSAFAIPLLAAAIAVAPSARAQELAPLPPPPPPAAPPAGAPVAPAPPPPPAATAPPAPKMDQVRFEPEERDLSLMIQTGEVPYQHLQRFRRVWYYERGFAALYSPVCEGPCATELVPGAYHLALSKGGGRAVPAGVAVLSGPATVHASYEDRSGLRLLGDVILVGGIIAGVVMIVASFDHQTCGGFSDYCEQTVDGPVLGVGIGVLVASVVAGTVLASRMDSAHVTVTPLTLPAVGVRSESSGVALGGGAGVTVRF